MTRCEVSLRRVFVADPTAIRDDDTDDEIRVAIVTPGRAVTLTIGMKEFARLLTGGGVVVEGWVAESVGAGGRAGQ